MRRRPTRSQRAAFTLVEVMMVVLIMAIMAGMIIPRFEGSSADTKDAALRQTLAVYRRQIEYFKVQHNGNPPGFNNVPMQFQLLSYTNRNGQISLVKTNAYKFGPYFSFNTRPINPINGGANVVLTPNPANQTPDDDLTANGTVVGFFYDPVTGRISANSEGNTKDGIPRIKL